MIRESSLPFDTLVGTSATQGTMSRGRLRGTPFVAEPACDSPSELRALTRFDRWCRERLVKLASVLKGGRLIWVDADGEHRPAAKKAIGSVSATECRIVVSDPAAYRKILFQGDLGFADALVDGLLHCNQLTELVRLFARNVGQVDQLGRHRANMRGLVGKLQHWLRRNNRRNAKKNIAAHYDLSNQFFGLWLDPTMSYSSGVFGDLPEGNGTPASGSYHRSRVSMQEASEEKLRRLCEKLDLKASDHLVEIGCGWGGLAIYAAQNYGCRVTGVTLSREQWAFATRRVQELGLEDRIDLRLCDYRDLEGRYDKLVSVEMIEAVGHQYLDQYFDKCCSLLKPEGRMALQAITIAEHRWASYQKNVDFIREYIFPGGSLPSVGSVLRSVAQSSDFRPTHLEDMGLHYAETLRRWRTAFHGCLEQVQELGFDDRFVRMWDYYLAYCEGAFEEGHIGTVQLVLDRGASRHQAMGTTQRLGTE